MSLPRAVLWFSVATFAGFGLAFTFFPSAMAGFVDIPLPTNTARVDFVATYGGFELGFAAFLWLCTRRNADVRLGLVASGCALGGFGLLRLAGILLFQPAAPIVYVLLAAEAAGTALCFWAARRAVRAPSS